MCEGKFTELLEQEHHTHDFTCGEPSLFTCGEPSLDGYLQNFALMATRSGTGQTFVRCGPDRHVQGFYTLTVGDLGGDEPSRAALAPRVVAGAGRHPIPAIVLARLGVHRQAQGRGLGKDLLLDALLRAARAASQVSGRLILVHPLHADAAAFYTRFGFEHLTPEPLRDPMQPPLLYMLMKNVRHTLGQAGLS